MCGYNSHTCTMSLSYPEKSPKVSALSHPSVKKQRVTMESVEKLVRKYYKTEEKQRRMLEMIHRKLDNLAELGEMFSSYSYDQPSIGIWRI